MKKVIHGILMSFSIIYTAFFIIVSFLSTMGMCGLKEEFFVEILAAVVAGYMITFLALNK